jgi:Fe-S-cluster containining protein
VSAAAFGKRGADVVLAWRLATPHSVAMAHPCLSCGACCARFRVAVHWSETDAYPGGSVPSGLTEKLDPHRVAMRGTQAREPHCVALQGNVGERVSCAIYAQRPSPCRELAPAWKQGEPSAQCDRARAAYGLAPLTPEAWLG